MQPPAVYLIFPDGGGDEADCVGNPYLGIGFVELFLKIKYKVNFI